MPRDAVLILTHSRDFYVTELVADALAARGARAVRVNVDRHPMDLDLSLGLGGDGRVTGRVGELPVEAVRSVWARRLTTASLPDDLDPALAGPVIGECLAHWAALGDLLDDRVWVNSPRAEAAVEGHKLGQLRAARAAGLAVPPTLITNDPAEARRFFHAHGGDIIGKMLTPTAHEMSGRGGFFHTQRLTAEHLEHLDELRLGPMCLQPRIVARAELRVAWVDGVCHVGAIGGADAGVDWRLGGDAWRHGALDEATASALNVLMRGMNLRYGAVDLMVPLDGPPIFLEVNPAGEWGMLTRDLGLPVAESIADALLSGEA
ncbi:MvdC family ATP-grasp ribosomal peptide maturase [Myxococcota bacterium]|nr:MvdC family ATP-grasp ribosomal peptide maturase [Myxococcota bacterium]